MTTKDIANVYLGNTKVDKLYLGVNQVYPEIKTYTSTYDLNLGTSSTTLTLPFVNPIRYENLRIDWGDGNTTIGTNTHTYSSLGQYQITIFGRFTGLKHPLDLNTATKLINISNWGDIGLVDGQYQDCVNLEITVTENTARSDSNWLANTFKNCKKLTEGPSISSAGVTNLSSMYEGCDLLTNIGFMYLPEVTNMNNFVKDCPLLDIDLSYMCVPLVTTEPTNFATGSPLMTVDKLPIWGTCP